MPHSNPTEKITLLNLPVSEKPLEGDDPAKPGRWISTEQYHILYGHTVKTIRRACHDGRLKYKVENRRFLVWDSAEVFTGEDPIENVPFIKLTEVAAIIQCTPRAVRYRAKSGTIKVIRVGGRMYTTISEVRRLIKVRENAHQGKRKSRLRDAIINLVKQRL